MIELLDKKFESYLTKEEISKQIANLAGSLNENYKGQEVVFIAILNGAFVFAADLYRKINLSSSSKLEVADVNGDGKSDLMVFDNSNVKVYYLNSK